MLTVCPYLIIEIVFFKFCTFFLFEITPDLLKGIFLLQDLDSRKLVANWCYETFLVCFETFPDCCESFPICYQTLNKGQTFLHGSFDTDQFPETDQKSQNLFVNNLVVS